MDNGLIFPYPSRRARAGRGDAQPRAVAGRLRVAGAGRGDPSRGDRQARG
jgi:hypothetical protein